MFNRLKLSGKIVGTTIIVLAVTSVISFWITERRINRQADEAFRDNLRQLTSVVSTN